MHKTFTCIICPNGCEVTVEYDGTELISCSGNLCKRGEEYVRQELRDPRRTISSSVAVTGGDLPMVSVRLTKPIPRDRIFDVMKVIREMRLAAPVRSGDVLISDILGLGSDLIATRNVAAV